MTNNTNNEIINNTNIENNGSSIYGKDIQDFDQMLSDTFSSVSILKDGSESFGNVTKKLMEGLKKQISVIFGKKIDVPFIFCLIDEKGTLQGTFNGFYDEYEKVLRESGEYFWENDYVPGKLFLPTFKNRQWSASPVMIYWNSTEFKNKEEFKESFNKTIGKFNKKYQNQIQFIGVYGSKDSVDNYKLKWGGIEANNPGINDSLSNNDGVQKGFLKAIAFLLQHTFKTSFASTPNDCYIFFIPSVFDADCRTGVLLLLLNPEDVLNETVQNDSESADIGKGLSRDEFYQKLLVITRAWGLATERQFLNHKNSRIQFQTIQEQADLFAEKITSQTLEQYLEQAFQSKPEFRNRICFIDLLCCNPDERNPNNPRVRITKDGNRYNQDIWIQGDKFLNLPIFNDFNNDNSLDIIKTMPEIDSPNDSFKYWESGIDYNNNNDEAETWSLYVNDIKNHKDNLKSYNNNEITHVVGIPFFDQDKKFIAGVLVGFASKNNENLKEDDFNKNLIVWLHLIIKQLTSAYIINTKRGVEQERDKRNFEFAKSAYSIGHSLKRRTGLVTTQIESFLTWRIDKQRNEDVPPLIIDEEEDKNLLKILYRINSSAESLGGYGHMLDIIRRAIPEDASDKQNNTIKEQDIFLMQPEWINNEPYEIKSKIDEIVNEENGCKLDDQPTISIDDNDYSAFDNLVIKPWISHNGLLYRPFDFFYDELFRETLLNARRHGYVEDKEKIVVQIRQDKILIDDSLKDVLIFSNKENRDDLLLPDKWKRPSSDDTIGGIMVLTLLLEYTKTGTVRFQKKDDRFELAFFLKGMAND